jgi:benzylsuccinate CoA-transferase BbsF subunit
MASLSGFYYLSGYSVDEIAPPSGAYTDSIVPRMAAFAFLGALDYRRRTGEGQHLDISQFEAAIHFMAPALIDYMSGGNLVQPQGNRSDRYAPHGAYRCADEGGEERWVTIAVEDDEQWHSVLGALGQPTGDPRFATIIDRIEAAHAVDEYVQTLVRDRSAQALAESLQAAGVAAYPVQNCLDLHSDENLVSFDYWQWLEQRDAGFMPYDGRSYRLDRTGSKQTAAPSLGAHNEEILGGLLGMSKGEMARLQGVGVVN